MKQRHAVGAFAFDRVDDAMLCELPEEPEDEPLREGRVGRREIEARREWENEFLESPGEARDESSRNAKDEATT